MSVLPCDTICGGDDKLTAFCQYYSMRRRTCSWPEIQELGEKSGVLALHTHVRFTKGISIIVCWKTDAWKIRRHHVDRAYLLPVAMLTNCDGIKD